jgi:ribosomal protein L11 methylase PrmA
MSETPGRVAGSFRDPKGHVLMRGGRVFRVITPEGRRDFEKMLPVIADAVAAGHLVQTEIAPPELAADIGQDGDLVVEHEPISFISYPYEWGFEQLRAAALFHLRFQLWLLERGASLSDATAYNVQFRGGKPVFIDALSIVPYEEGAYWAGYRQFCEQFLNPLLLRALRGIAHNAWFRGALEGITTEDLAATLSLRDKLSFNVLAHVVLLARLQRSSRATPDKAVRQAGQGRGLSVAAYRGILTGLKSWITRLQPRGGAVTTWGDYAAANSYQPDETTKKAAVITEFVRRRELARIIDLGCNSGNYSVAALDGGAREVVGFDFDQTAVDRAFDRARSLQLPFLPLWLDAANPSPDQGWRQKERDGLATRAKADGVLALAFEHHLAIGRNIPLDQVVDWIVEFAPHGIIEFVPKSDPTVQFMLALRPDVFPDYTEQTFREALGRRAEIVSTTVVSESGRVLYEYSR